MRSKSIQNHPLLIPSMVYFFYYASVACVIPYLNVFFQNKGISLTQIGFLAAMPNGLALVAAPLWAGIADYFGLHRRILPLIMALTIPFILIISIGGTFAVLLPGIMLFGFCNSPVMTLSDNSVLGHLGEKKHLYGNARLWGSFSWAAVGWLTGWLIEKFGPAPAYLGFVVFMLIAVWLAFQLPEPEMVKDIPYWENLGRIIRDKRWLAFLGGSFLIGIAFNFLVSYIYIFMQSLGAHAGLMGMGVAAISILEIPFFFFTGRLLKKVAPQHLLLFASMILILRSFLTAMVLNPIWVVAANLLNGPFFSTFWSGSVVYARQISPRGMQASGQALFAAAFTGLGGITGAILGGWLYSAYGAPLMFNTGAVFSMAGLVLFVVLDRKHRKISDGTVE